MSRIDQGICCLGQRFPHRGLGLGVGRRVGRRFAGIGAGYLGGRRLRGGLGFGGLRRRALAGTLSTSSHRASVAGSELPYVPDARRIAMLDPNEPIEFAVLLRRRPYDGPTLQELAEKPFGERVPLGQADFEARYGADPDDVTEIETFAGDYGLDILGADLCRRMVTLCGTVANLTSRNLHNRLTTKALSAG